MNIVLALVVGSLFASGTYLLLRRSTIKMLFGLVLLGNATNIAIFTSVGIVRGHVPIIDWNQDKLHEPVPDPLAQALILTAIVISFAVLAFAMVLVRRGYDSLGTDDIDSFIEEEGDDDE